MPQLPLAEESLDAATEALFNTFARYAKPPAGDCIDTCGAPIPESARAAWSKSLREYTADEVDDFGHHSLCLFAGSPGWREEYPLRFKYWLPRFLQGLADHAHHVGIVFDDWFLFEGFQRADWPAWPKAEAEAVNNWTLAWLDACLAYYSGSADVPYRDDRRAESAIDFAIQLDIDPTPQLYAATATLTPTTVGTVTSIVKSYVADLIARQLLEDGATPGVLIKRKLLLWLMHASTTARLEQAYFAFIDTDAGAAAEISVALEWLANLRSSYANSPQGWPAWLAEHPG